MATQATTTGNGEEIIRFKDAIGRKFVFPFELVKTWHGIAQLVKSAFVMVDVLGPHVQNEHFDMIGPDGDIILPLTWAARIRPGMAISMQMWPIDKAPPRPPFMPPGVRLPPPWANKQPPMPVPHPPGPAAGPPVYPEHVVPGDSAKPKARKTAPPTLMQLMRGSKPIKKNKGSTRFGSQNLPPPPRPPQQPAPTEPASGPSGPFGQPPQGHPSSSSHPPGFERVPGHPPRPSGVTMNTATPSNRRRPSLGGTSSGSSSSSSSTSYSEYSHDSVHSRPSARNAGLVVNLRRNPDERRVTARQLTMPILEPSPTKADIIELSPGRVYPDEIGTSPGLTLELTRLSSPPGPSTSPSQAEKITWAHVSRSVMDLAEFENIALNSSVLKTNSDSRLALEAVFRTLNDKKLMRSRDNWFIQPGTVLRCDVDSGNKTVASATFASVPQLQADPLSRNLNVKFRKGICMPRRLHEAFDPYDTSFERDKNQAFRKGDGAKDDAILWVCETWVLIVDSTTIITYGDLRRRLQLQGTIDIREPVGVSDEKVVHVTTPEHAQFQIPMHDCETFFKLQSSIHEQMKVAEDRFDLEFKDFDILTQNDEPLTAKVWSELVKATRENSVHVKIGWLDDSSSAAGYTSSRTSSSLSSRRSSSILTDDIVEIVEEPEFFSMQKVAEQPSQLESFTPPELHSKVPPFLGWSILESSSSSQDLQASQSEGLRHDDLIGSIRACLIRTETGLVEGYHPHVASLKDKFAGLDFKPGIMQFGVENIDMHIQTFGSSKRHRIREQSDQDDRGLHLLCRDYLLVCVRALEAFTPKTHSSTVLSLYYDSLSKTAQHIQTQSGLPESSKWVLSHGPPSAKGYKFSDEPSLPQIECSVCENGTIYASADDALEHLRKKHHAEMISESRLREYLVPLADAAGTKLKEESTNILAICRDMMVDIIKQAREIQEGVVSDDRFRKPAQGVPYALLKTFQLLVAQVCAVPILLADLQTFYTNEVYEEEIEAISLPPALSDKWRLLKSTDLEVSSLMKTAERALIAPAESRKKEDVVKFFNTIGAHGLALQMISNVLQEPTYNNSNAAELYSNYMTNLGSQVIRRSSKRQIPTIAALADELGRLADVIKSQQKLIQDLRTVLKPDTHLEPLKTDREKTFRIEEFIIDDCQDKLQEQIDMIGSSIERGDQLISTVHEFTEIMKDDHSRAIFVFTVVTVVFLPLSFVAAYLSMNGGPSEADSWGYTQRLFWKIAAPLAIGIGAFCLVVAWPRPELQAAKTWVIEHATRLKARFSPNSGPAESSASPATEEMK